MKIRMLVFIFISLLSVTQGFAANTTENVRSHPLKGTVALTFDDGPNPIYTPQILAILKKNHIHATFFMVGVNAKKYPEIVKMVQADGQAIASHTLTHPKLTKLSDAGLQHEVLTTQTIIKNITGKAPACLRPPFGLANAHVREYIRSQGITPVAMGWNSFDYEKPGVDKIVSQVVNNAHSGQVFLLHDGYADRGQTVAALPRIIAGIRKKGLGFSDICAT